jgi:hypothetical protein
MISLLDHTLAEQGPKNKDGGTQEPYRAMVTVPDASDGFGPGSTRYGAVVLLCE